MPWPMRCTLALQWYKGVQGYCIIPNMQYILKQTKKLKENQP